MAITDTIPTNRPPDTDAPVLPTWRRVWPSAAVVAMYLVLGGIAYWPVLPDISGRAFSVDTDFIQSVWFIGWIPHALVHGLNPFFSGAIYVPTGVNLAQNTASPFLGLLTAPLALVLSPLVIANLLMVLGMPVSAIAAFVVLRKWRVWWPAAALGGLIYGFSPCMVSQSVGHLELTFLPLPPFIALTVASILQRRGSSLQLGLGLGLLVTAQYLISPEVLAVVAVLTVVAIACVAVRHPSTVASTARAAARPAAVAFGLTAVLLAYPVWMLLDGPQHFVGTVWPLSNPFHNDVLSFVAPGPLQRVSLGIPSDWGGEIANSSTEAGGYIGVPMLVIVAFLAWRSRRSPRMQLAMALLISAALLSLGPYLSVNGRTTHFPLPFLVLGHLPMLDNILPSRISFGMDALLAAVIAFGLDDMRWMGSQNRIDGSLRRDRSQERRATAFAGLVLVTLVATQLPGWPYAKQVAVGLPADVRSAIPTGDPVAVTYPYSYFPFSQSMLWQAQAEFAFRITGGYAYHPSTVPIPFNQWRLNTATPIGGGTLSPNPMGPPGLQTFLVQRENSPGDASYMTINPALVATTRVALSDYRVRLVIVDRSTAGSNAVIELFTDALGPPTLSSGTYSVWTDRHGVLGR
jgi:hypothetical protein